MLIDDMVETDTSVEMVEHDLIWVETDDVELFNDEMVEIQQVSVDGVVETVEMQ